MKSPEEKIAELLMEQECITDVLFYFDSDIHVSQIFDAEDHGVYRVQFNYYQEYCMNDMNKHIANLCLKNNMTLEQLYADLIEKRVKVGE